MFKFIRHTREKTIKQEIDGIVLRLTDDYTDAEIGEIVNSIKERSLVYLKYRKEHLTDQLRDCNNSIDRLNCVHPEQGLYILDCAMDHIRKTDLKQTQLEL